MKIKHIFLLATGLLVLACSQVPQGVLDRKKMEQVLYDVHVAEGIMDEYPTQYRSLESKQKLMAGVFRENGITKAEFDSSMVFYGANLDQYMKIYQKVTERLNAQRDQLSAELTAYEKSLLTPVGDSVNMWRGAAQIILDPALLATTRVFEIKGDSNFRKDDRIVWSMRFNNLPPDSVAYPYLAMGYLKGDKAQQINGFPAADGWFSIELTVGDELNNNNNRLFGSVSMIGRVDSAAYYPVYIDSVLLMRYHYVQPAKVVSDSLVQPGSQADSVGASLLGADSLRIVTDSIR